MSFHASSHSEGGFQFVNEPLIPPQLHGRWKLWPCHEIDGATRSATFRCLSEAICGGRSRFPEESVSCRAGVSNPVQKSSRANDRQHSILWTRLQDGRHVFSRS